MKVTAAAAGLFHYSTSPPTMNSSCYCLHHYADPESVPSSFTPKVSDFDKNQYEIYLNNTVPSPV